VIKLHNVVKYYRTRHGVNKVINGISLTIKRGEKVGILGRNGAGKSTLIRLISGAERPSQGKIESGMSVSWPLAFGGAFQPTLTGLDNLKFICRVYGVTFEDKVPFINDFTELGKYLREPVRSYSSGMRARLAFGISLAVEFDCFLIDEIISVGDARFHSKCNHELFEKRCDRAFIIVSHEVHNVREHCNRAFVLYNGKLIDFSDVNQAIEFYHSNC
jgi:capsular polysaccharide transport system ATP-binding protein